MTPSEKHCGNCKHCEGWYDEGFGLGEYICHIDDAEEDPETGVCDHWEKIPSNNYYSVIQCVVRITADSYKDALWQAEGIRDSIQLLLGKKIIELELTEVRGYTVDVDGHYLIDEEVNP